MFTGIIRHVGQVLSVAPSAGGRAFVIELGPIAVSLREGDSVAVNGACLTARDIRGDRATFDAVHETLARTTLGRLVRGRRVNLEPAMRLGEGLDGHLVQGHVDGTAQVTRIDRSAGRWEAHFAADAEILAGCVAKGSIALDGVSLTLAGLTGSGFHVALIPTTLGETTLASLVSGDVVNVETDLIGKYVRKYLGQIGGGLTEQALRRAGFA